MSAVLIAELGIATLLERLPDTVLIVPRTRCAGRWMRQGSWRPLDAGAVLESILQSTETAVVLARRPVADPGAACLPSLARLVGREIRMLPDEQLAAAWSLGVLAQIAASDTRRLAHALDVLLTEPRLEPGLPERSWGASHLAVPALRPATLARWAGFAWRPCGWCVAGGLPGSTCRRCAAPVPAIPAAS